MKVSSFVLVDFKTALAGSGGCVIVWGEFPQNRLRVNLSRVFFVIEESARYVQCLIGHPHSVWHG